MDAAKFKFRQNAYENYLREKKERRKKSINFLGTWNPLACDISHYFLQV